MDKENVQIPSRIVFNSKEGWIPVIFDHTNGAASEISLSQKEKYHIISLSYMWNLNVDFMEAESRIVVTRGWGREEHVKVGQREIIVM